MATQLLRASRNLRLLCVEIFPPYYLFFGWVRTNSSLTSAPSPPFGTEVAVLDHRRHGDDVVLPDYVVDVDLHDFEVRHHGAYMR